MFNLKIVKKLIFAIALCLSSTVLLANDNDPVKIATDYLNNFKNGTTQNIVENFHKDAISEFNPFIEKVIAIHTNPNKEEKLKQVFTKLSDGKSIEEVGALSNDVRFKLFMSNFLKNAKQQIDENNAKIDFKYHKTDKVNEDLLALTYKLTISLGEKNFTYDEIVKLKNDNGSWKLMLSTSILDEMEKIK